MRGCLTLLAFCLIFAIAGCSKPETVQLPTSPQPTAAPGAAQGPTNVFDACSLLTSKQIEAIQGAPLKETKPSASSQAGLAVSQCSFLLPTPAESIVVTVTQRANGSNSRDPKQLWEGIFHGDKEKDIGRKEEESKSPRLEKIGGLGDEAFWTSQRFGGKLFVLKGNIYISISVGGPDDQATKLQKSKALAEIVLKRL